MLTLPFTVDAELLRELGERLVGKPHIALAELIKNSYDADATEVTIKFFPDEDCIKVSDDGHGMTFEEFKNFWMRIGTTHKSEKRSKNLGRQLTGSKGVGRLAVQFLANNLAIITVSEDNKHEWLEATINWEKAIEAGELTKVAVRCTLNQSDTPLPHGTSIILKGLKDTWDIDSIRKLASEVWWLQPPFGSALSYQDDSKDYFQIDFQSTENYTEEFEKQIEAIKRIWIARLVGKNVDGQVTLSLEFPGEQPITHEYSIANLYPKKKRFNKTKNLNRCNFEIRIYNLSGKQKLGIKVGDARDYFEEHGGVHVYDGNFRLPYYGLPTSDWLRLEYDHSHRRAVSELLPKDIKQAPRALNDLPTLGRILGIVNINTSQESNLKIMITRDRLAETAAYNDLVNMIRYAIDWYANKTAWRKIEAKKREVSTESTSSNFERVEQVLEEYEPEIPQNVYQEIYEKVREATVTAKTNQELVLGQIGLLAPLATAGISALSYQHELRKQFTYIEDAIERIKAVTFQLDSSNAAKELELQQNLDSLSADLSLWLDRAKATNSLFDYIADAENTKLRHRFRAVSVIKDIVSQTSFLARGIEINYSQLEDELYLPKASFAEWGAIFQNVFTNAYNAMLDSSHRLLHISFRSHEKSREILIQDTGHGIDLEKADKFFDPFERASKISAERQALGYGGTGLGLTIVRLLADNIGCRVQFVAPQNGFRTAFSIRWRDTK